jgi:hypothetical protein
MKGGSKQKGSKTAGWTDGVCAKATCQDLGFHTCAAILIHFA